MSIERKASCTLMAANLIAIILVIAVHYNSKAEAQGVNYVVQEFLVNGIARVAVPFFSFISGYFLANDLHAKTYIKVLWKKSKTLLVPYLLASLIIFLSSMAKSIVVDNNVTQGLSIQLLVKNLILNPKSTQFWFLRDLIILTIMSPLLISSGRNLRILMIVFVGLLWLVDIQPFPPVAGLYFLNIETLFFFMLGGLSLFSNKLIALNINANKNTIFIVAAIWTALLAARIVVDPDLDVWYTQNYTVLSLGLYKSAILIGLCSLIHVSTFVCMDRRIIYFSGLTFFAYLYHFAPLSYFRTVTDLVIPQGWQFYIDFPVALVAVFTLAYLLSRIYPNAFAFMTGGRNPSKALNRIN